MLYIRGMHTKEVFSLLTVLIFFYMIGDEIKTVDDVVMDYIQAGHDVYEIKYKPPSVGIGLGQLLQPMENSSSQETGPLSSLVRWLVRTVASSVVSEMNESASLRGAVKSMDKPIQERYMALDDTADRVRSQD